MKNQLVYLNLFLTLLLATLLLVFSTPSWAAKFANQFTEFELPPQWQCNLEGAEWVCQNTNEAKKRDAIIVLAAKLKGDQDSLDQYKTYLTSPKTYTSIQGKTVTSAAKYAKMMDINGTVWVDSLHLDSEIPGFYTRYLATVKSDIGVLVTYSINQKKYQEYLQDFENLVKTLKVFRRPGGINVAPAEKNLLQNPIPPNIQQDTVFQPPAAGGADSVARAKTSDGDDLYLYLIGGAVALIAFLMWRRRR